MAEVYWDLEWTLQQQGFDYTYDKRLYDRLRDQVVRPVREQTPLLFSQGINISKLIHFDLNSAISLELALNRTLVFSFISI